MTIELKKWRSISQKDLKILVLYQELKCEVRYFYLIFIIMFYNIVFEFVNNINKLFDYFRSSKIW